MSDTAPRFRRTPPVTQYGSADLRHMTPEEIATAEDAGHFHDLIGGRDPDASVDHMPGCTKPTVQRDSVFPGSTRVGDTVRYRCPKCSASKEI